MQSAVATPAVPLDDPSLYLNRELSWLEFNRRVLEEAQDPQVPLLERLKFLAIFSSNLDEFFMVRVGGLQQKVSAGITFGSGGDRMPAREQLEKITQEVRQLVKEKYRILHEDVLPGLEKEGIVLRGLKQFTESDIRYLHELFRREVFPVVTPLAIDPGHPFPHLLNKSLNLAVLLKRPRLGDNLFAVVQVPAVLNRFVQLPSDRGHVFTSLETVIRMHLPELFAGMEVEHQVVFRVTRDSDFEIEDDEVQDLLKTIEEEVRKRGGRGRPARNRIRRSAGDRAETHGRARPRTPGRLPRTRFARLYQPVSDSQPGRLSAPARSAIRAAARSRIRQGEQPLVGDPGQGHSRAPPLRILWPRGGFHRRGGGR